MMYSDWRIMGKNVSLVLHAGNKKALSIVLPPAWTQHSSSSSTTHQLLHMSNGAQSSNMSAPPVTHLHTFSQSASRLRNQPKHWLTEFCNNVEYLQHCFLQNHLFVILHEAKPRKRTVFCQSIQQQNKRTKSKTQPLTSSVGFRVRIHVLL